METIACYFRAYFLVLFLSSLNWTLLLEVPVLAFAVVLEFVTSVMLSIGVAETCATVKDYNE